MSKILWLIVLVLFCGCGGNSNVESPLNHFEHTTPEEIRVSQRVDLSDYEIYKPVAAIKDGNSYLIEDKTNNNMIHFLDIEEKKIVSGVNKGNAPDELISPANLHQFDGKFFIYDIMKKFIYRVVVENEAVSIVEHKRLTPDERLFVTHVAPKGFIASGIFKDAWLTYYDEDSNPLGVVDFPDFEEINELTDVEKSSIYISTTLRVKPDHSKVVCASQMSGVVSFSTVTDTELVEFEQLRYHAPLVVPPRSSGSPSIAFDKNNKVGFCGSACDDNYVFLSYSGRTVNTHQMLAHHCDHLFIYDWNGKPLKHLLLELPLFGEIGYDPETKTLYGISYDPEGVIVEYNLSHLL